MDLRPTEGALRPFGLRAGARRRRQEVATSTIAQTPTAADAPSPIVGPHLTGLRRAAHQLAAADAL